MSVQEVDSPRELANLIAAYAFLNDDADIEGLGDLFAKAVVIFDGLSATGKEQFEAIARSMIPIGADGHSATSHEITNLSVDVAADGITASGRSYWTLYHCVSGEPRVALMAGRYRDKFRQDQRRWRFVRREIITRWRSEPPAQPA